ncbi:MAG: peptidylprolyl isomerase [candidate division KSB1 bacterium]|jgi:peptidylprolyl isomerase|nr:peptidylprolyl isomerase [candidate division KSB1 bacterium]
MKKAANGDKVKVHYTGYLDDGTIFDSSEDKDPLEFTLGEGQLLKGFENAVEGLQAGDKNKVKIPAEEGYGMPQDSLIGKVPLEALPKEIKPELGMKLQSETPEGDRLILKVIEISEEEITVDANHELAGQDLNFDIELVEIN